MKRKIRFRGKIIDSQEWVIGNLIRGLNGDVYIIKINKKPIHKDGHYWYLDTPTYQVIPETVGQSIGIKDKNEVDIYEDDIITYDNNGYCLKVEYEAPEFVRHTTNYGLKNQSVPFKNHHVYEVIGNIHTNPELLK